MCEMVWKLKNQGICRLVALVSSVQVLIILVSQTSAQLAWSPIQVDSESESLTRLSTVYK